MKTFPEVEEFTRIVSLFSFFLFPPSQQVEKNRLILKTVGKRHDALVDYVPAVAEEEQGPFRMPFLQQSQSVPRFTANRIHRSGYPKFDIFHEMDLRNLKHFDPSSGNTGDVEMVEGEGDDVELVPNRTPAAMEYREGLGEEQQEQENDKSIGLNI